MLQVSCTRQRQVTRLPPRKSEEEKRQAEGLGEVVFGGDQQRRSPPSTCEFGSATNQRPARPKPVFVWVAPRRERARRKVATEQRPSNARRSSAAGTGPLRSAS